MKIGIIDCGGANLSSIGYSINRLGYEPVITNNLNKLKNVDKLIIPGVGSADRVMNNLKKSNLDLFIKNTEMPILGICIGMQILFDFSQESNTECLGIIEGVVEKLEPSSSFPSPQMGWNLVTWHNNDSLNGYYYYANSYAVHDSKHAIATSQYSKNIVAEVQKDNYIGCQFHPEKSQMAGLKLLDNFVGKLKHE